MQLIPTLPFQMTAIHLVIGFQVTEDLRDAAKQICFIDDLARADLLRKETRDVRFQFVAP